MHTCQISLRTQNKKLKGGNFNVCNYLDMSLTLTLTLRNEIIKSNHTRKYFIFVSIKENKNHTQCALLVRILKFQFECIFVSSSVNDEIFFSWKESLQRDRTPSKTDMYWWASFWTQGFSNAVAEVGNPWCIFIIENLRQD